MQSPLKSNNPICGLTPLPGWRISRNEPLGLVDCSLIVATYKRPEEVKVLLRNLAAMLEVPVEILIIDGSPSDDTERVLLDLIGDLQMPFELVYVRSPKGLTRQRNVGVDISTKQFLFFLDDDALPMEGYFRELRRALVEGKERQVGAAGACIVNEINKPIPRRWRVRRAIRLIPKTEPLMYNHVGTSAPTGLLKPFSGTRDVDIFPGGACAIRRDVFDSMRFSEFFAGYSWGEDLEMSLRIRQKWRVQFCGDAHVFHRGLESAGGRPAAFTKSQMEVRNRYFIWKRYSANASLLNEARFCLDVFFVFVMDLAWLVVQPWQYQHISHAFGILSGAASCLFSPPKWEEPLTLFRYRLAETPSVNDKGQSQSPSSSSFQPTISLGATHMDGGMH